MILHENVSLCVIWWGEIAINRAEIAHYLGIICQFSLLSIMVNAENTIIHRGTTGIQRIGAFLPTTVRGASDIVSGVPLSCLDSEGFYHFFTLWALFGAV